MSDASRFDGGRSEQGSVHRRARTQETLLTPDWALPPGVFAAMTTRAGGASAAPYDRLNLGAHVGDAYTFFACGAESESLGLSLGTRLGGGLIPPRSEVRAYRT